MKQHHREGLTISVELACVSLYFGDLTSCFTCKKMEEGLNGECARQQATQPPFKPSP